MEAPGTHVIQAKEGNQSLDSWQPARSSGCKRSMGTPHAVVKQRRAGGGWPIRVSACGTRCAQVRGSKGNPAISLTASETLFKIESQNITGAREAKSNERQRRLARVRNELDNNSTLSRKDQRNLDENSINCDTSKKAATRAFTVSNSFHGSQ